jgi:hypothetical protein
MRHFHRYIAKTNVCLQWDGAISIEQPVIEPEYHWGIIGFELFVM